MQKMGQDAMLMSTVAIHCLQLAVGMLPASKQSHGFRARFFKHPILESSRNKTLISTLFLKNHRQVAEGASFQRFWYSCLGPVEKSAASRSCLPNMQEATIRSLRALETVECLRLSPQGILPPSPLCPFMLTYATSFYLVQFPVT